MEDFTLDKNNQEKLVKKGRGLSLKYVQTNRPLTNKEKPKAEAHIRPHKVKGKIYYYYCRGIDKEIYLGTADRILEAVQTSYRKK